MYVTRIEDGIPGNRVEIGVQLFQTFDDVAGVVGLLKRGSFRFLDVAVRDQAAERDKLTKHAKLQETGFSQQDNRQCDLRADESVDAKRAELRLLHDGG